MMNTITIAKVNVVIYLVEIGFYCRCKGTKKFRNPSALMPFFPENVINRDAR